MGSEINLKAKIERHSRILKENLFQSNNSKNKYSLSYKIVLFFVVLIFPLYPVLASFVYDNSVVDFYRGDIDESSILSSYYGDDGEGSNQDTVMFESEDGNFLSVNTILKGDRDLSGSNEIINYDVKNGDSIASIASKFGVSRNSIYWANNFSDNVVIHPGDKIKVPPVSGLIHEIKKGDTISTIAKKYGVDEEKILKQNLLTSEDPIKVGDELVIPGGIKEVIPVIKQSNKLLTKKSTKTTQKYAQTGYSYSNSSIAEYVEEEGEYILTKVSPQRSFYWGNCTRYVAQYKNVTWGGNAKDWLRNAEASGVATGTNPKSGAIVVFNGKGYNPRYGHVGIVTSVKGGNIIVKDMNYRALNEVTVRKVPVSDSSIKGYIYAD
nr:LysM peptidoglycan-binding domain-containing protein [Candidatus Gracilibacteria bacterium]